MTALLFDSKVNQNTFRMPSSQLENLSCAKKKKASISKKPNRPFQRVCEGDNGKLHGKLSLREIE